jgi:carbonic anhydrase
METFLSLITVQNARQITVDSRDGTRSRNIFSFICEFRGFRLVFNSTEEESVINRFSHSVFADYSYKESDPDGPSKWKAQYPSCGGVRQSPININWWETQYVFGASLVTLVRPLKRPTKMKYRNYGQGFVLTFKYSDDIPPGITGGPLGQTVYVFEKIYMHWKSEHTVNNNKYDAESQILFFNAKYQTFDNAEAQTDGIVVLGILHTVSQT